MLDSCAAGNVVDDCIDGEDVGGWSDAYVSVDALTNTTFYLVADGTGTDYPFQLSVVIH